jgi:hypothetical protein
MFFKTTILCTEIFASIFIIVSHNKTIATRNVPLKTEIHEFAMRHDYSLLVKSNDCIIFSFDPRHFRIYHFMQVGILNVVV